MRWMRGCAMAWGLAGAALLAGVWTLPARAQAAATLEERFAAGCTETPLPMRPGCIDSARRSDTAERAYALWLADRLAEDGGARNLAFALFVRRGALLTPETLRQAAAGTTAPDPTLAAWYRRAWDGAGDDGVAWSLLASAQGQPLMPALAGRDAVAAWAKAQPDNLAPMLLARRDGEPMDAIFAALDTRSRNAVYWNPVQALAMDAVRRHPPKAEWRDAVPALRDGALDAYGLELGTAVELPSYRSLIEACGPPARDTLPERRAQCRRLGTTLQDASDAMIARMVGNLLLRLSADDDASRAAAHAAWRPLFWRQKMIGEHGDDRYQAAYRDALRADPAQDEVSLVDHALRAVDVDPAPPADWETTAP